MAEQQTAVPQQRGAIAVVCRQARLLVIQRSQLVVAPGTYCFPGGAIEAGETEVDALRREFREELAAPLSPRRRIWQSITPWHVHLSWWLAELAPSAELTPNRDEVESVHWLTVAEIRSLPQLLTSNHAFLDAWERGEFALPLPRGGA